MSDTMCRSVRNSRTHRLSLTVEASGDSRVDMEANDMQHQPSHPPAEQPDKPMDPPLEGGEDESTEPTDGDPNPQA